MRTDNGTTNKVAELTAGLHYFQCVRSATFFFLLGDYFGETALMNNDPRGATVRASGPVTCMTLDQESFTKMFGAGKLRVHKRVAISAESNRSGKKEEEKIMSTAPPNATRSKTREQIAHIEKATKGNALFEILNIEQRTRIIGEMWQVSVAVGENLIVQGDLGNHFYVVQSGNFDIFVDGTKRSACGPGQCFGELTMLYKQPRAATVTAKTSALVWAFDRYIFKAMRKEYAEAKAQEFDAILVKAFAGLLASERAKIAGALDEIVCPSGHVVFKQGDPGDTFYIVRSGEVVITQVNVSTGENKELCRVGPGSGYMSCYFGERSLIKKEPRAATVTCTMETTLVFMAQHDFINLLGPAMDQVFAQRLSSYDESGLKGKSGAQGKVQEEEEKYIDDSYVNEMDMSIRLEDLTIIGTLGRGSFGHVQLVKDRKNKPYALKCVNKAQIIELGQQEHILSEKKTMSQMNHICLIRLYATFKDASKLYFLLEPSLGGELFTALRAKVHFDHNTARFYAAGVVLGFEYMHSKGIIYRDLKPENILLAKNGYIKITDFGFAKVIGRNEMSKTFTLCGTPDYLAPEVVGGEGHNKAVDWWTLGVLIYEMLASYCPFYDEDPMKTYTKIMQGNPSFPPHFKKSSVDMIKKLLTVKPAKRLGSTKQGVDAIKTHEWYFPNITLFQQNLFT